ncbi:hypothetical protein B0H13DRAFT_1907983 [Mycena leptocephala]|nr:hypothetical protein B0H13DRAFT_1907983 [Mycena leptocephala]
MRFTATFVALVALFCAHAAVATRDGAWTRARKNISAGRVSVGGMAGPRGAEMAGKILANKKIVAADCSRILLRAMYYLQGVQRELCGGTHTGRPGASYKGQLEQLNLGLYLTNNRRIRGSHDSESVTDKKTEREHFKGFSLPEGIRGHVISTRRQVA